MEAAWQNAAVPLSASSLRGPGAQFSLLDHLHISALIKLAEAALIAS